MKFRIFLKSFIKIVIVLIPIVFLYTACSRPQVSCEDAKESHKQCLIDQEEHKQACFDSYSAIAISEPGMLEGSVESQGRIDEYWEEYEGCVALAPSCEEEKTAMDSACDQNVDTEG
ncbi:MAG: hypothetical protein OXH84_07020 [Gammaproteobacteria bacterium]|nr:hypothetical protein [Gammaproteobacteria bacterium]